MSIIGAASTGGGALLGSLIDQSYDGTVTFLTIGFLVASIVALALCLMAGRVEEGKPDRPPAV